jgi:hypothetical protein
MNVRPNDVFGSLDQVLAEFRPVVLVFLPNTNELQRFVLSGAFNELAKTYQLRFVFRPRDADVMRAAAPALVRSDNSYELDIPEARYREWDEVFNLSCHVYADRSRSFALRVGASPTLKPDFEVALLRTAWKIARRARPILRRIPALRKRWGEPSHACVGPISKFIAGDDWVNHLFNSHYEALTAKLRNLQPYGPMIEFLNSVDPLFCVLPTSLLDHYCNDLLLAANQSLHTVIALQSGWDNLSSKGIIQRAPQFLGVWGPQSGSHASNIQGVKSTAHVILGSPHYEALVPASSEDRERFRAALGVSRSHRLVLFGGSFRQFDETAVLQRLERQIEAREFGEEPIKILYRPHPWRKDRLHEDNFFDHDWRHVVFDPDMEARYRRSKVEARYLATAPMFDMSYLATLLSAVDAVISPMSTLLIEALIIDKPTMAVAFGDDKHAYNPATSAQMTHFEELKTSGILEWCADAGDFEASCRRLIARCGQRNDAKLRRETLDLIVLRDDQSYAQRLGAFARTTLEPAARRRRLKRGQRTRASQSHIYHSHLILKEYCSLPEARAVPGHWIHGWIPAHHSVHPFIFGTHKTLEAPTSGDLGAAIAEEKENGRNWVGRRDQEDYLRGEGYRHVKAIGLPFAYLPPFAGPRIPGSLLVMPPHGHRTHGPKDRLADAYADAIASKRKEFSEIWLCLNAEDYRDDQWIESFRKRDIPMLIGAEQGDPRTLHRLKHLLSSFEYVTTNGFGSHIAYAAAVGAKLSIFGPVADCPRDIMAGCYVAKTEPALTDVLLELQSERSLRRHFPFLFVDPEKAECHETWGAEQIGADLRLAPADLMALFGWNEAVMADATG